MTTDANTITEKQMNFIRNLLDTRAHDLDPALDTIKNCLPEMSKQQASDMITALLKFPEKEKTNAPRKADNYGIPSDDVLPSGRYAIDNADGELTFYNVWRGTKNPDYVKLYVLHGPDQSEVPFSKGMVTILKSIAADAGAAAIRYGHEIGACSQCGLRLTNRVSRALGIGPICGGHFYGEEFKSVVHGAREQIKAQGLDPDGNVEDDEEVTRYDVRGDFVNPAATAQGGAPTGTSAAATLDFVVQERAQVNHTPPQRDLMTMPLDSMTDAELTSIMTRAATILEQRAEGLMGR